MPDHDDGGPLLGIDLGTSTCEACVAVDNKFHKIQPDRYYYPRGYSGALFDASYEMPSAFAWRDGEVLTGQRALDLLSDPDLAGHVVVEIKRKMDRERIERISAGDQAFWPSEIAGYYVQVLRIAAEKQLGLPDGAITGAVVTIPASFGQLQIEATLTACRRGGLMLDRVRLIDEPVAAAYSLGLHKRPGRSVVLVADIGGGTFDVTLLRVGSDVGRLGYEELGRDGDLKLGGLDWDREIAQRVAYKTLVGEGVGRPFVDAMFGGPSLGDTGRDLEARIARIKLFEAAERAKRVFYGQFPRAGPLPPPDRLRKIDFEFELKAGGRPRHGLIPADIHLRDASGLVGRCLAVCERMFRDVSQNEREPYGWSRVDEIFLAGGGSLMATVRDAFARAWKKRDPVMARDPQHAVAQGAALCAEDLRMGREVDHLGKQRYPHSVGIASYERSKEGSQVRSFSRLVPRHAVLPFSTPFRREYYVDLGDDNSRLEIEIEEESASLARPSADGPAAHPADGHQLVKTLVMTDLPPPILDQEDTITVEVDGTADALLRFRLACRGKSLEFDYEGNSRH
jgi:molecular chaperone DnaK (HSP70)